MFWHVVGEGCHIDQRSSLEVTSLYSQLNSQRKKLFTQSCTITDYFSPKHWLGWDLTGISAAILGCYLPGIYYAFYCFPVWRDIYLAIVLIILVITLVLPALLRDYLVKRDIYPK